ncbi:MAG: amidophosphoribosyltransferase [Gammaproteobacteria bacterium]|nr:amidophosphoribosyltransferase [Gammaproteobacteria bacterium]NNJ48938.1 amidophosphoribosyltransferase [Gammaproteobacteria bacterium]
MCGITGIVAHSAVNLDLYESLSVLQHRGQDAAGITTCENGRFYMKKGNGLVRDVFYKKHMQRLPGKMGIAHARYPTAGTSSSAEAQPLYVNSPYGIALAHNGNLTNAEQLKEELFQTELRHLNTDSDTEALLNIFAHELQLIAKPDFNHEDIFIAVEGIHRRCRGGYAVVAMVVGKGILAIRDPNGIRPLCYGIRETELGPDYMVASESVALQAQGFELVRDIEPGEAIFISEDGEMFARQCAQDPVLSPCIFEYVYFARPDSIIDGISVYKSRLRMGQTLVQKILREQPDHDIDVVIPIPDTSRSTALEVAFHLNVKYREGFIKNRYIGRTFIMPGQKERKKSVRQKLNPIELEFAGKNVLLVDDSIVRGTTSKQIVQMAREAGAKKVYMASAAPPVRHPNVYGIDMASHEEFVAHDRTVEEITEIIGADWLIYQGLDDLIKAVRKGNKDVEQFDCSCFDGVYITNDVDDAYFKRLNDQRNDSAKNKKNIKAAGQL